MLKLSFILPCYNVAPYIGRCIESIEHQDIPREEYEVICVDDCSKDNTVEVIKEYQKQYPNIRLICHEVNKTAGGARNTGMDAAKGEYLWFVDPDDAIVENVLVNLTKEIEKLRVDILFFNYNYIDEESKEHAVQQFNGLYDILTGQEFFLTYCKKKRLAEVISIWREVFSANYLKNNNIRYPEIKSSQDVVFAWHAYLVAQKVTAIEMIVYNHIRRALSTTGSSGRFKAKNVISASILYPCEILNLTQIRPLKDQFVGDLQFEAQDSVNTDSRKVLKMMNAERKKFYEEMKYHADKVDNLYQYMNRKTRKIFNYHLPYPLWLMVIWGYMIVDNLKGNV